MGKPEFAKQIKELEKSPNTVTSVSPSTLLQWIQKDPELPRARGSAASLVSVVTTGINFAGNPAHLS